MRTRDVSGEARNACERGKTGGARSWRRCSCSFSSRSRSRPPPRSRSPTPPPASAVDWTTMNSDANHTNYVAQNQIGASNAQNLQLGWSFPFPAAPNVPGLNVTGQGSISPPLVVNGTVYVVTNYLTVYAINGETGAELWSYAAEPQHHRAPPRAAHGARARDQLLPRRHLGEPARLLGGRAQRRHGEPGHEDLRHLQGHPGNAGFYAATQVPPVFDGNTMIWTSSVSVGTDVGRGFVAAYDITNGGPPLEMVCHPARGGQRELGRGLLPALLVPRERRPGDRRLGDA